MLLHILGGGILVANDVLYNYVVIPLDNPSGLTFLKFDQVVHTYGSIVAALIVYFFLARGGSFHPFALALLSIAGAMGIGAMNEIIEFVAKMTVPDTDVGGYYNTAVDLVVNLAGSVIGTLIGVLFWKKHA
jgi:putative membrane protein